MKMGQEDRWIEFTSAYDKRSPDPNYNYGIGDVCIIFRRQMSKAVMQFTMSTSWFLPHVQQEMDQKTIANCDDIQLRCFYKPSSSSVCYHSPEPVYDGHHWVECDILEEGRCYSDCEYAIADKVLERLIAEGHDGVWNALEEIYYDWVEQRDE